MGQKRRRDKLGRSGVRKLSGRNRQEGWKHAKVDGHLNEDRLSARLNTDLELSNYLSIQCFSKRLGIPSSVSGGGASADHVTDVFGGWTNGKPDLEISWGPTQTIRVSVKKSRGGQVFLTSVDRFSEGFQKHFGKAVPSQVKKCLNLFIGGDRELINNAMKGKKFLGPKHRRTGVPLEVHQGRLVALSLAHHFSEDWDATLTWFKANIGAITDFAFARGYAKQSSDFATHLWYVKAETLTDNGAVSKISDLVKACTKNSDGVAVGPKNGGTTIQLPFGFLQMHAPKSENLMQFHHSRSKISALLH